MGRLEDDPQNSAPPEERLEFTELDISGEEVQKRIAQMAKDVAQKYIKEGKDKGLVIAAIEKGGIFFAVDFGRALQDAGIINPRLGLIDASSYEGQESGELHIKKGFGTEENEINVEGQHVLLVDDVADTGNTLSILKRLAIEAGATVDIAVLGNKPDERKASLQPDFVGFNFRGWVYGNGMDTGEDGLENADNGRFERGIRLFTPPQEQTLTPGNEVTPETN